MEYNEIVKALKIRYVDLKFRLVFQEECCLPQHKTSALRGGMGQMLLRQNCIGDEKCEECTFETECLVRRMMYAKYEIQPDFAKRGDSMGYVIECDSKKEHFQKGEHLEFHLLLYGKLIVHFSQFLQAFYMLGQMGIGKEHARYTILCVEDENGGRIVDGSNIYLQRLHVNSIEEYVKKRMREMQCVGYQNGLRFLTPATLKYEGNFLQGFHAEAIVRSILRRIYCFDCFEGIDMPLMEMELEIPEIVRQEVTHESVPRYSSTMGKRMSLKGIRGSVLFDYMPEELLMVLLAGEKLHIGKNTSFGFGKYQVF